MTIEIEGVEFEVQAEYFPAQIGNLETEPLEAYFDILKISTYLQVDGKERFIDVTEMAFALKDEQYWFDLIKDSYD